MAAISVDPGMLAGAGTEPNEGATGVRVTLESLAVLAAISLLTATIATAAPMVGAVVQPDGHNRAVNEIYYYHGRNYPYYSNHHYYRHRHWYGGRWRYY